MIVETEYANPFNVSAEEGEDGGRWYTDADGRSGPSVTTALSLRPPWSPQFKPEAMNAVEHARQRGTELHRANAFYAGAVPGQELDWDALDPEVRDRMDQIDYWKARHGWVTEHAELRLFHSVYGFGGTIDEIGSRSDLWHVLDFKPPIAPLAGAQLAGYALLVRHVFKLEYVPGRISLHLDGEGEAREVPHTKHARDRDAFLAALAWFNYGREKKEW